MLVKRTMNRFPVIALFVNINHGRQPAMFKSVFKPMRSVWIKHEIFLSKKVIIALYHSSCACSRPCRKSTLTGIFTVHVGCASIRNPFREAKCSVLYALSALPLQMPLPPGRARAFEAAGKQSFVWGWEAINKGLVSAADRAYMKAPSLVHRPQPMGQNVPNLWTP